MKRMSIAEQTLKKQIEEIETRIRGFVNQQNAIHDRLMALSDIKAQLEREMHRLRTAREKASDRVRAELRAAE